MNDAMDDSGRTGTPDLESVEALLASNWARPSRIERLPGENLNLAVTLEDDRRVVLKITVDPEVRVDLEDAVATALAEAGLPVASAIPARSGATVVDFALEGRPARARVQQRLPGMGWRGGPLSRGLARRIGATIAEVLDAMHVKAVHRVWVVDDAGRPVGVVALSDILAAIAVKKPAGVRGTSEGTMGKSTMHVAIPTPTSQSSA